MATHLRNSTAIAETRFINVAQYTYSDKEDLGPGRRFLLWVQGCPFRCANCTAPNWIPERENQLMSPSELVELIRSNEEIDGVTISGGEPFLQAGMLALFCKQIRQEVDVNIIVFTGFLLEELSQKGADQEAFLAQIDLLIDGQYIEELNDNKGLRGSSNQRLHFLTDRLLKNEDELVNKKRSMTTHLTPAGPLMSGVPPKGWSYKLFNQIFQF